MCCNKTTSIHLHTHSGCVYAVLEESRRCNGGHCGFQSLKYWLSGPLQKKIANPCSGGRKLSIWSSASPFSLMFLLRSTRPKITCSAPYLPAVERSFSVCSTAQVACQANHAYNSHFKWVNYLSAQSFSPTISQHYKKEMNKHEDTSYPSLHHSLETFQRLISQELKQPL